MTKFAMLEGEWQSSISMNWWWLRSPGNRQSSAVTVDDNGSLDTLGDDVGFSSNGVRPALWVEINNK